MVRRPGAKRRGQALVEFAILLPLILILLLGMIEFGLLLYNQHVITNASREGARYGIVSRSPRRSKIEIDSIVGEYCGDHLVTFGSGGHSTYTSPDPPGGTFGENLTVMVEFPYEFLVLPQFLADLAGVKLLQATTMMKYE